MASKRLLNVLKRNAAISLLLIPLLNFGVVSSPQELNPIRNAPATPRSDAEIYAGVKSVVDMSAQELIEAFPEEMERVKFEENRELLAVILEKTGAIVEAFFRDFPKILAHEQIRMERLTGSGAVVSSTTHDYLYSFSLDNTGLHWEETRTERSGRPVDMDKIRGYLFAPGRTGLTVFLHPLHRHGSRFRYLGRQADDAGAHLIAFAQIPEVRDYLSSYQTEVMVAPAPLLLQGLAWIHPENHQIIRLRTDLLAPRNDIGLSRQTSEIRLAEVHFASLTQPFWLPQEVVITNKSYVMNTRNRHRYSRYQLFTVTVEEKIAPVKK
jgi:hypothetical protein